MRTKYNWKEVEIDFKNGMSTTDIHIKYGMNRSTIIRHFKKLGFNVKRSRNFKTPFSNIENKNERDYWLGFILADGYITRQEGRAPQLGVNLGILDKEHLSKLANFLGVDVKEYNYTVHCCRITYRHPTEIPYLESLGIKPKKSFESCLNVSLNWDILRGIIDGDGSITKKKCINISSSNKEVVDYISSFLVKEGVSHRVSILKKGQKDNLTREHYTIYIHTLRSTNKHISNKLYPKNCIKLERKYNKFSVGHEKL